MITSQGTRIPLLGVIAVLIALLLPLSLAPIAQEPASLSERTEGFVTFQGPSGPATLAVELADTPEEHTRGLMYRESLPEGAGMLFIFEEDSPRSFWMRNTLIPLDMIFINSSLEIVKVVEDAQPCRSSCACNCPSYRSGESAMYVVEANSGFAREHGLSPGDGVGISLF